MIFGNGRQMGLAVLCGVGLLAVPIYSLVHGVCRMLGVW